ncbi:MAG: TIGR01777 family oxidoreductase, partial [Polyangiales bacterium]
SICSCSGAKSKARTALPVSAAEAFAWHERPGALERLTPPWERFEVSERQGGIREGDRLVAKVRLGPCSRVWEARHTDYLPGEQFVDEMVRGPMAYWRHVHRFEARGATSELVDHITYRLPAGALGRWLGQGSVEQKLERMFCYRHAVTRGDLARLQAWPLARPQRIVITGQGGMLGQALTAFFSLAGHEVVPLRRGAGAGPRWQPDAGRLDAAVFAGADAVVHLAGENIASGRWTAAQKAAIEDSRVRGTALLAQTLARLTGGPKCLITASGIGYYGPGEAMVDENSGPGDDFLARVCQGWEQAAAPAKEAGLRLVHLRFGVVLAAQGGALRKMLPAFRAGVGGRVGDGKQMFSWVSLDDAVDAIYFALAQETLSGAVNVVSPAPVSNAEFTATLARVLGRPAWLPAPAAALRLVLGREMADSLLLSGRPVWPRRLEGAGFSWRHPGLEAALRHLLGRAQA